MTRVALVTGAGRNIGRAIAAELGRSGAAVVLNGRAIEPLGEVAAQIEAAGGRAATAPGDVSDDEAVARIFAIAEEGFGHVDVLVNNAAVRSQRPFLELPVEEWNQVLRVGLDGAFLCSRAALPSMVAAGWGRIVHLAGVSGQIGTSGRAGVATAKAGLIGLTRALATEFAGSGVTVMPSRPAGSTPTAKGQ